MGEQIDVQIYKRENRRARGTADERQNMTSLIMAATKSTRKILKYHHTVLLLTMRSVTSHLRMKFYILLLKGGSVASLMALGAGAL